MTVFSHGGEAFLFHFFSSIALLAGIMVIRAKNPVHSVLFLILVFCNASGLLLLLGLDFFAMIFLVVYVGAIAVLFLFVVMMLNIKLAEINENTLRYLPIGGLIGLIFLFEIFLIIDSDLIPLLGLKETSSLSPIVLTGFFSTLLSLLFFIKSSLYFFSFQKGFSQTSTDSALFHSELKTFLGDCSASIEQFIQNQEIIMDPSFFTQWSRLLNPTSNIESIGQLIYTYYFFFFLMASLILLVAMIGAIVLTMHKGVAVKRQEIFEQNTREFTKTVYKVEKHREPSVEIST